MNLEKLLKPIFGSILLSFILSFSAIASDISQSFEDIYNTGGPLSGAQVESLADYNIVFIPGFMSETFNPEDRESDIDLSFITNDYFGKIRRHLKREYGLSNTKLLASSRDTAITKSLIINVLEANRVKGQKTLFISHSLGGVVLLDVLVSHKELRHLVAGNIFMQTPFWGTPLADVYESNFFYVKSILKPIFKMLNLSSKTVSLFSPERRREYMQINATEIENVLDDIPSITFTGKINSWKSIFRSSADIIESGCLRFMNRFCLTKLLHDEAFDKSDGVVPLESSKLPGVDYIIGNNVDHGETILTIPFKNINQKKMTETLLKIILDRLHPKN